MFEALSGAKKVVGIKQTKKALQEGTALRVMIAADADERVTGPIRRMCETAGIPVEECTTMRELGEACGIDVGAAAAAILVQ